MHWLVSNGHRMALLLHAKGADCSVRAAGGCAQVVLELQERGGSPEAVKGALCGLLDLQPGQVTLPQTLSLVQRVTQGFARCCQAARPCRPVPLFLVVLQMHGAGVCDRNAFA